MATHYLVTEKGTGKRRLVQASQPAIAIADAAKELFTAKLVDGDVLEILKETMPVHVVSKRGDKPAEAAADGQQSKGGENDDADAGDAAAEGKTGAAGKGSAKS